MDFGALIVAGIAGTVQAVISIAILKAELSNLRSGLNRLQKSVDEHLHDHITKRI